MLQPSHHSSGIIPLKLNKSLFKWRHFELTTILMCVKWNCRYQLSDCHLEEIDARVRALTGSSRWVQIRRGK